MRKRPARKCRPPRMPGIAGTRNGSPAPTRRTRSGETGMSSSLAGLRSSGSCAVSGAANWTMGCERTCGHSAATGLLSASSTSAAMPGVSGTAAMATNCGSSTTTGTCGGGRPASTTCPSMSPSGGSSALARGPSRDRASHCTDLSDWAASPVPGFGNRGSLLAVRPETTPGEARYLRALGQQLANRRDDHLWEDVAIRLVVMGLQRALDLLEVVRRELEGCFVWLVAPADRVIHPRLCRHLDMAAEQVCHRLLSAPVNEPVNRTDEARPVEDVQAARVDGVPGEQDPAVAVVEGDRRLVVPRRCETVKNA